MSANTPTGQDLPHAEGDEDVQDLQLDAQGTTTSKTTTTTIAEAPATPAAGGATLLTGGAAGAGAPAAGGAPDVGNKGTYPPTDANEVPDPTTAANDGELASQDASSGDLPTTTTNAPAAGGATTLAGTQDSPAPGAEVAQLELLFLQMFNKMETHISERMEGISKLAQDAIAAATAAKQAATAASSASAAASSASIDAPSAATGATPIDAPSAATGATPIDAPSAATGATRDNRRATMYERPPATPTLTPYASAKGEARSPYDDYKTPMYQTTNSSKTTLTLSGEAALKLNIAAAKTRQAAHINFPKFDPAGDGLYADFAEEVWNALKPCQLTYVIDCSDKCAVKQELHKEAVAYAEAVKNVGMCGGTTIFRSNQDVIFAALRKVCGKDVILLSKRYQMYADCAT